MQADGQDLAERVKRLEDREAIRDRWYDYIFALDSGDWPALADVFTEDATLEMVGLDAVQPGSDRSYHGRAQIIDEFYKPVVEANCVPEQGTYYTGHHGTNMKIELDGDSASTLAYFFEILGNSSVLIGTYQHRVIRQADVWRFSFLRIAIRYGATVEVSDLNGLGLAEVRRMAVPA